MGRPKKRQRAEIEGDEGAMADDLPLDHFLTGPADVATGSKDVVPSSDFNNVDSMFALDGMLQPWTVPGLDWSMSDNNGHLFNDSAPDLTRDNSSEDSPPVLNVSTELHNHHYQPPVSINQTTDISTTDQHPTCACLSTLYLTLSNLATMDSSFSFPTALYPPRSNVNRLPSAIMQNLSHPLHNRSPERPTPKRRPNVSRRTLLPHPNVNHNRSNIPRTTQRISRPLRAEKQTLPPRRPLDARSPPHRRSGLRRCLFFVFHASRMAQHGQESRACRSSWPFRRHELLCVLTGADHCYGEAAGSVAQDAASDRLSQRQEWERDVEEYDSW